MGRKAEYPRDHETCAKSSPNGRLLVGWGHGRGRYFNGNRGQSDREMRERFERLLNGFVGAEPRYQIRRRAKVAFNVKIGKERGGKYCVPRTDCGRDKQEPPDCAHIFPKRLTLRLSGGACSFDQRTWVM